MSTKLEQMDKDIDERIAKKKITKEQKLKEATEKAIEQNPIAKSLNLSNKPKKVEQKAVEKDSDSSSSSESDESSDEEEIIISKRKREKPSVAVAKPIEQPIVESKVNTHKDVGSELERLESLLKQLQSEKRKSRKQIINVHVPQQKQESQHSNEAEYARNQCLMRF